MAYSQLKESSRQTWTFDVSNGFHLDAPQKAKSMVSDEENIPYDELSAKVVKTCWTKDDNSVVVVRTG